MRHSMPPCWHCTSPEAFRTALPCVCTNMETLQHVVLTSPALCTPGVLRNCASEIRYITCQKNVHNPLWELHEIAPCKSRAFMPFRAGQCEATVMKQRNISRCQLFLSISDLHALPAFTCASCMGGW
jgi:hypothetical protein